MKSTFKYLFTLLAIYLLSLGSVLADPALVIRIDSCGLFDGNAVLAEGTGVTVSAQNANGNTMHTCTADVTPPTSGRTAVFNIDSPETRDRLCGLDGTLAITSDWHEVITKNGKAKLVCHFHE